MALRGEWVGNTFYDTPSSYGSYQPLDEMNALAKFGHVLQSIGDEGYLDKYNTDKEKLLQQNRALSQRKELSQFALNMPSDPRASMLQLMDITGDPSKLIDYEMQQADPLRKAQLANAQFTLQTAKNEAGREERIRDLLENQSNLQKIAAQNTTSPVNPMLPPPILAAGQMLPQAIPAPKPLSVQELSLQLAINDPKLRDNYLAQIGGGTDGGTATLKELAALETMSPQKQELFWRVKRAEQQKVIDTGAGFAAYDLTTGKVTPLVEKQLAPADRPETRQAQAKATAVGQLEGELQKKAVNAESMIDTAMKAKAVLPLATGSGVGALRDVGKRFVGASDEQTQANETLDLYAGWLTSNVPRMEGPQSDKDTLMYREMAARVGDRSRPVNDRMVAIDNMIALQQKYAQYNKPESSSSIKFMGFE